MRDSDRGGSQSPEAGELGLAAGQTLISRIGIQSSGERVLLNDNDNPEALTLEDWFGGDNETSLWRLYLQTDDGVTFSQQLNQTGGGFANFAFDAAGAAILNAIAAGDRFLIALARQLLPVAASLPGEAGSVTVALTKQAPANKAIATSFGAAAGSVAAAVEKQGGDATKAVAASLPAEAATLAAALGKALIPQPLASLAVSESSVEIGRSVELRWVTSEALSAAIDQGIGAVPLSGSLRVSPERATTYTLTATGQPGSTPATAAVTVAVNPRAARSLLPPNATPLERAMEAALREPPLDIPIRLLWSWEHCPINLLPYLAWALGVEDWDSDWPEAVKRAAVRDAFRIHREKGTLAGLKRVLMNAGAEYEYVERPSGVPMTARLLIFNSNAVYLPDIVESINRVKRASLDLETVLASAAAGDVFLAGGLGATTFIEISGWSGYTD